MLYFRILHLHSHFRELFRINTAQNNQQLSTLLRISVPNPEYFCTLHITTPAAAGRVSSAGSWRQRWRTREEDCSTGERLCTSYDAEQYHRRIYTVSQEKNCAFVHNCDRCWQISNFFYCCILHCVSKKIRDVFSYNSRKH